MILQSLICLRSWNPTFFLIYFLHCIHLNVSRVPQVNFQSNVNTCPLTSPLLDLASVLLFVTQKSTFLVVLFVFYYLTDWLKSPPNFRHSQRGDVLPLVSSLAPRHGLEIGDWRTGSIMADMTRQVTADTLDTQVSRQRWQRLTDDKNTLTDFFTPIWHMHTYTFFF